jgi:hypothetical protein
MLSDLAAALALTIQPRPCREIGQGDRCRPCLSLMLVGDDKIYYSNYGIGEHCCCSEV